MEVSLVYIGRVPGLPRPKREIWSNKKIIKKSFVVLIFKVCIQLMK